MTGLPTAWLLCLPCLAAPAEKEIVFRGHATCLDDSREPYASGRDCPDEPSGGWAIRSEDGTLHRLSPRDKRVVMLSDVRVRSRPLHVEAWQANGELAIVHLYSVVDGRLHEPHYYCRTCAIRDYTPGLCSCCRAPYEFREPALER